MNYVKKHKLLAIEALQYNKQPYIKINNLWQALHQIFNLVQNYCFNSSMLDKSPSIPTLSWPPFSNEKFINTIAKYNNLSTSGPDYIL